MSSRRTVALLAALCLVSLALSLWAFTRPAPLPDDSSQPLYILADQEGRLAVYGPEGPEAGQPIRVYEIYTRLLPETDQRRLAAGMEIYSETELQQRLEDYGL